MNSAFVLLCWLTFFNLNVNCVDPCEHGKFGRNCQFTCHCLYNDCIHLEDSQGCRNGTCIPGYTDFPRCQEICSAGWFGIDCKERCECTPQNLCSNINGNCVEPNKCVPERTGPGCRIVLSSLKKPPLVEGNCTNLTVSWFDFDPKIDSGESDVREYRIEIKTSTGFFSEARTVEAIDGQEHVETFTDLPLATPISFRIVPRFYIASISDGYLQDGIPSPPSAAVTVYAACINQALVPRAIKTTAATTIVTADIRHENNKLTTPTSPTIRRPDSLKSCVGPSDCRLIGVGQTWSIFAFQAGRPSCIKLGRLVNYELDVSLSDAGDYLQRFYANLLSPVVLATNLTANTLYQSKVVANYERGSITCLNVSDSSFLTSKPSDMLVQIQVPRRLQDMVSVSLKLDSLIEASELRVTIFEMKSVRSHDSSNLFREVQTRRSIHRPVDFFNLKTATLYRIYAWVLPTNGYSFQGNFKDVWTPPEHFRASENFAISPPTTVSLSDTSFTLLYPNVTGYTGGPINEYYLAISPGHVVIPTYPSTRSRQSSLREQLSLPESAKVVFFSTERPNRPIVVGDGKVTHVPFGSLQRFDLISDPPLKPASPYTIFVVVRSVLGVGADSVAEASETKTTFFTTSEDADSSRSVLWAILSSVFILFSLMVLLICLFIRYKRNLHKATNYSLNFRPKRSFRQDFEFGSHLDALPKSYAAWSLPTGTRDPRFLVIDPERGPDSTLLGTKGLEEIASAFQKEYDSLPGSDALPHTEGEKPMNRCKNRTRQALPYDHSRVVLKRAPDSTENDYINASFVDSYMRRKAYVAAQNPFNTTTASDFWLLIVQQNISQIVLLTNQIEDGAVRCTKYWPEAGREDGFQVSASQRVCGRKGGSSMERQYDSIVVLALDVKEYSHFSVRRFQVTDMTSVATGGGVQFVTQYHFHSWRSPCSLQKKKEAEDQFRILVDQATAPFCTNDIVDFDYLAFIDFYLHVKTATKLQDGPILVHCEEGVARTSVFIAFDTLFQQMLHEHSVTVARTCSSLRRSRPNMVPTPKHFALLYDLLFEASLAGHSLIDLDVRSALKTLSQKNVSAGFSYLTEQWFLLHNYTPPFNKKIDLVDALSVSNSGKNRYPNAIDFLPPDRYRPRIPPFFQPFNASPPSNYINAVYADSVGLKEDIIITQTPMRNTVWEFWRLVFEEKVSCIVDMDPSVYGKENSVRYWPVNDRTTEDQYLAAGDQVSDLNMSSFPFELVDVDQIGVYKDDHPDIAHSWYRLDEFQICQLGALTGIPDEVGGNNATRKFSIFRRHLLIRRSPLATSSPRRDSNEEVRTVNLFHFKCDWKKDAQIPASKAHFLHLLEVVSLQRGLGPLLVHCLDGATRSGLFVANFLLNERMSRDHFVDLFHLLKALKLRRRAIISSVIQLRFTYQVLASWVELTMTKPIELQQSTYPISFIHDPFLSVSSLALENSRGPFSSQISMLSGGDAVLGTHQGNVSNSAPESSEMPPRRNVVLYRYFNEELSKLVRSASGDKWAGRRKSVSSRLGSSQLHA